MIGLSVTQTKVNDSHLMTKASGVDEVYPEHLKSQNVVSLGTCLSDLTWWLGTVSFDWHGGVVVPLYWKRV